MGAIIFFIFMMILALVALFFIALSIIFIVLWVKQNKKGKRPKKLLLALPIAFLAINIFVALMPVGFIAFLRIANHDSTKTILAESGIMLYWPMGEYEPTTSLFSYDEKEYVQLSSFGEQAFYFNYNESLLGEPIANITYNPAHSSRFNDFMWVLLSGKTFSQQNISTIYSISNPNGFDLLFVVDMLGGNIVFCAKDSLTDVVQYYLDISNYNAQNVDCSYFAYSSTTDYYGIENGRRYKKTQASIAIELGTLNGLYSKTLDYESYQKIDVPQEYILLNNTAADGTPVGGYKSILLSIASNDSLMQIDIYLSLIENQIYSSLWQQSYYQIDGFALPFDLNQRILTLVFDVF